MHSRHRTLLLAIEPAEPRAMVLLFVERAAGGVRRRPLVRVGPRIGSPARVTLWADNRDQRFTASLDTILDGIQAARGRPGRQPGR